VNKLKVNEKRGTVQKTLQLLELLANSEPLGIRDIARLLQTAPSSTFRILNETLKEGFVEKDENNRYDLGVKMLQLVDKMQKKMNLPSIVRPYLEKLSEMTDCTSFLGVMRENQIVYILQVQSHSSSLQLNIEIGTYRPMYCTGLGKAILAFLPKEKMMTLLSQPLEKKTEKTLTDIDLLLLELDRTRVRGYAVDNEEIIPDVSCIAAPIYDINENVIASISISGHKDKFTNNFIKEYSEKLISSAQSISSHLGYQRN
jgi:IclR family KDG regulon transcriptional repressor